MPWGLLPPFSSCVLLEGSWCALWADVLWRVSLLLQKAKALCQGES